MSHWIETHKSELESIVKEYNWDLTISNSEEGPVIITKDDLEISIVQPSHVHNGYTVEDREGYIERWPELDYVLEDIERLMNKK